MAEITADMSRKISSLILSIRKARIATIEAIDKATRDGRIAERNALTVQLQALDTQFAQAGQVEIDFLKSNLSVSKAEKRLAKAADEGRRLVRRLDTAAKVLKAVTGLTKVLTALANAVK
jgi:hypothetical protein